MGVISAAAEPETAFKRRTAAEIDMRLPLHTVKSEFRIVSKHANS
jgi:hypothetical protein